METSTTVLLSKKSRSTIFPLTLSKLKGPSFNPWFGASTSIKIGTSALSFRPTSTKAPSLIQHRSFSAPAPSQIFQLQHALLEDRRLLRGSRPGLASDMNNSSEGRHADFQLLRHLQVDVVELVAGLDALPRCRACSVNSPVPQRSSRRSDSSPDESRCDRADSCGRNFEETGCLHVNARDPCH